MPPTRTDKPSRHAPTRTIQPARWVHSSKLFGDADQVVVIHEGLYYRLRKTANGKLLLLTD